MPREWFDWRSAARIEDEEMRKLYLSLLADKKPYFMRYIYPALMKQYNTYIKSANKKAQRDFGLSIAEMLEAGSDSLSERENDFLRYYHHRMPVGVGDCVTNRICRKFEAAFDGYIGRRNASTSFDYTMMKSGAEYSKTQYNMILRLYTDYSRRLKDYAILASRERIERDEAISRMQIMGDEFRSACDYACSNAQTVCDILLDICYQRSNTKSFAWNMCGQEIVNNLLRNNGNLICFPVMDSDGDVSFGGKRFLFQKKEIGVNE